MSNSPEFLNPSEGDVPKKPYFIREKQTRRVEGIPNKDNVLPKSYFIREKKTRINEAQELETRRIENYSKIFNKVEEEWGKKERGARRFMVGCEGCKAFCIREGLDVIGWPNEHKNEICPLCQKFKLLHIGVV
ncbi:MAG: hypothetical protein UR31_C0001G0047 [Parcubacteria group bacterium GW2011_GWA2_33_14]|uniref:Uncharacterized protein n=1 Tax=Candidatus Staskawiczbacteria bacterium RIFCSPHIGHO2_02_FULL_33_16 TaxID=1802204 RepID=A0A1G2HXJ6_9BACT|nr:MAG: hypothetical protein UR31_C0001G0047 [Parcubacteria group bacterium GW2011_GWA2_33_14]OGZ66931.1 MAG: hypothetical protein A3D34_02085 [Candidatus Staskawiczbacteria bacterium RIFCSPHIGHO2_02_FULL_33_16]OGZ70841.1 MAG: hypothetical protein A2980_02325 [Candidatus Staskawiczbacteria bacterium RIFCSPLOWO2_01_FULL_33_13]